MKTKNVIVILTWLLSIAGGVLLALPAIAGLQGAYGFEHYSYEQIKLADPYSTMTEEEYENAKKKYYEYKPYIIASCITQPFVGIALPWVIYWCGKGLFFFVRRNKPQDKNLRDETMSEH